MITQPITQSASFLYKRGPIYYFRRHVPSDLRHLYKSAIICTSLRTRSHSLAQRGASVLASKLDAEWMTLRLNGGLSMPAVTSSSMQSAQVSFAKALDLYLRLKSAGKSKTFETGARRSINYLSEAVKDKDLASYNTVDAGSFRDYLLEKGLSSSSVRRVFSNVKAIYSLAASEFGLQQPNPFAGVYLPDLKDVKKRQPVSPSGLKIMQRRCQEMDDDLRWIVALVSDSGVRLSESVGLYWSDVSLDSDVPFMIIRPNDHRRLKTENSARVIPLVGMSLWALRQAAVNSDSNYVFPRYMKGGCCNANSASAAINKWIKALLKEDVSVHSLRHSMRDRLRAIKCPTEVIDQIGGWSSGSVGSSYGEGYPLTVLSEWMEQI